MSNRTLGDDIEDHAWGKAGISTGSFANQVGLDEHNRTNSNSSIPAYHSGRETQRESEPFEDVAANLIALIVWIAIGYYGTTETNLEWYWPVGVGFAVSVMTSKLLSGPLRFLMTILKWSIICAIFAGLIYLFQQQ